MEINENQLHELLGRGLVDFGATFHAGLVVIGDELGLYRELAAGGEMTSAGLAERTQTTERYVREWLRAQAAGGYVNYDSATDTYSMTPEQAMILADEHSPAFIGGGFQTAVASLRAVPSLIEAFRTGKGLGWHEHHPSLFPGVERFFKPTYENQLVQSWIPSLNGIDEKLKAGGRVADVGCGYGASTIIMAKAYPNSTFVGYDYHDESIAKANAAAEAAGVSSRVTFKVAGSSDFGGGPFDLITTFDCLHDMGNPAGAAAQIWQRLAPQGSWMIVEPFATDTVAGNLNPVGRAYYGASTLICTPCSLDQEVGLALGAQAGEAKLREVVSPAGFSSFARVAETPFNLVLEARK
ncbi:MAG: methyltransferase domain-containing protein [Bacteroidetes bacterium]|nr:methyltransferase domain-containing protein [Bacteroidota bacterium]